MRSRANMEGADLAVKCRRQSWRLTTRRTRTACKTAPAADVVLDLTRHLPLDACRTTTVRLVRVSDGQPTENDRLPATRPLPAGLRKDESCPAAFREHGNHSHPRI